MNSMDYKTIEIVRKRVADGEGGKVDQLNVQLASPCCGLTLKGSTIVIRMCRVSKRIISSSVSNSIVCSVSNFCCSKLVIAL